MPIRLFLSIYIIKHSTFRANPSMKKKKRLSTKQLLLAVLLLLGFTAITLFLYASHRDEKKFRSLSTEMFRKQMSSSTLNMHYTIAYPENFGITDYEITLPIYQPNSEMNDKDTASELLELLSDIDPQKLSSGDAYTYQLLLRNLMLTKELASFPYYSEPLSPAGGMQTQLPILLAEYAFRSKKDVEEYLKLLDQVDDYFASLLIYEREKKAAGLLQSASSLEKVKKQCDTIVTKDVLKRKEHFLQTTFVERMLPLLKAGILTAQDMKKYSAQNDRLLSTVVAPAYIALADGLFILEDDSIPLVGLSHQPGGADYYLLLLQEETGSYRDIDTIRQMLTTRIDAEYRTFRELATKHTKELSMLGKQNLPPTDSSQYQFPLKNPTEMLADLQKRMQQDFPPFPSLEGQDTFPAEVAVKTVSPSLEAFCAPAFYLTVPLDAVEENSIYINQKNSPSGLDLYTTLAHEGYPGHMYQTIYSNQTFRSREENLARKLLWYGGYLEGWALYVEFLSYDYAVSLLKDQSLDAESVLAELEKHSRSMQLCLYSLLDIQIHYLGANPAQVHKLLAPLGIKDERAILSLYAYIVEEPCNYLKYYLGYLEILSLRDKARELWGENYSDYSFHEFFLNHGPSDFQTLEEALTNPE